MRLFSLIDFHHFILALFLGTAAALVIYLIFRYGPETRRRDGHDNPVREGSYAESPDVPEAEHNPAPPVLVFLFVGFVVWLICYVIFFAIRGGPM